MSDRLFDPPPVFTERQVQTGLQEALTHYGWKWVFVRRMQTPDGRWLTGTSDAGWLDLTAFKPPYIAAIEVKSLKGRVTPGQHEWLRIWYACGAFAWVLDPRMDRAAVARWLADPSTAPLSHGWNPADP